MTIIKGTLEIQASPGKVWNLLTDLGRFHEWAPVKMKLTSEKQGLGATYHTTGKFFGLDFEINQRCVEWEENRKWSYTMTLRGKRAKLSWILEPWEPGTKLTEIFKYELPYSILGNLIDKLMFKRYIKKMMERELRNLKLLLEKIE